VMEPSGEALARRANLGITEAGAHLAGENGREAIRSGPA
jgi:hypothetical protein